MLGETPQVLIAGQVISASGVAANAFTATHVVTQADGQGETSFSVMHQDIAGNRGAVVTASTDGTAVTIDHRPPELLRVSTAS